MTTTTARTDHGAAVFWRYWTATSTSAVGSAITSVALPLTAISLLHASAFQVGLLVALGDIGWLLLTLPAGAIATHAPLRGLQAGVDLVRGAGILTVPVLYATGWLAFWHLLFAAFVISCAQVFAFVANTTYIPSVVPSDQLAARNALMSGTEAVTQLGGPSLAGVIVQWVSAPFALLLDALSYLLSGALMWTLPRAAQPTTPRQPMARQVREGWQFVVRHPMIRPLMIDATVTNFVCGALLTLTPLYLLRNLGASPWQYGVLVASEGCGALVGATLTTRLQRRFGMARTLLLAAVASTGMLLLIPLGDGLVGMMLFAVGNAGFALMTVILSVLTRTYRQQASPPEMLARVMATVRFVSWSVIPVGGFLAGVLAQAVSARTALFTFAVAGVASPLVLWFSPVRDHLDDVDV